MSDEKRYTEREVRLRERRAFQVGADWFYTQEEVPHSLAYVTNRARAAARECYELPKVTRPRVVRDPENGYVQWRVAEDGYLQARRINATGGWMRHLDYRNAVDIAPIPERVKMWADLLANPTEVCDAED
jgi:hypothetical protein